MARKTFFLSLFIFFFSGSLYAQSSLVPVYHQVYDWLHYQRVLGNSPQYNYESLPLTRGQITNILASIEDDNISSSDKRTKHSYLREFSADTLEKYKYASFFTGKGNPILRHIEYRKTDEEHHVYTWNSDESNAVFDVILNPSSTIISDNNQDVSSPFYLVTVLRSYGTFRGLAGFHVEQYGVTSNVDGQTFTYIPFLGRNAKFLRNNDSMEHFEAFASLHKNDWSFAVGRGTLKNGVGKKNSLIYSREGIPFDWIRFNIDSKYIDYTSVMGFLTWTPIQSQVPGYPGVFSRTSPSRYTVMHKIQFQPFDWLSIGYYEMINYSNREFEIGYFNPVTRLTLMEFEQDDQDNGFAGILGSLRPINGLELYAELLIDDIKVTRDIFLITNKNRDGRTFFAHHLGGSYALKSGQVFNINYQRLDPNIYAHKFPFNAHSESGFSLGSQLGPNADEWSFNFDQWFSLRSRLTLGYSINRHGLNFFDGDGNLVDVGGDISESYFIDPDTRAINRARSTSFLKGDLHEWNTISGEFEYQIYRGLSFSVEASYRTIQKGSQMNDLLITTFGIKISD